MMTNSQKNWDIFCKVVDNFGDIGICWRLAKQLHHEHGLVVRLFVDHLSVAAKLLTGISDEAEQGYDGVTIVRWDSQTLFNHSADVVVETFACGLPTAYLALMQVQSVWVNVDYLSAEAWVPEFHGRNGKHHDTNLTRYFYFPGFNEKTGGLLREQDLIKRRDAFQNLAFRQRDFWQQINIHQFAQVASDDLKISLFSYADAPISTFLQVLAKGERQVSVFMPFHQHLPHDLLGRQDLAVGDCIKLGHLTLFILPFLSQQNYDFLLWSCDVNFVRGEDSWVRAIWAGKPFVWQPYWQEDNTHLLKLNAFLDGFYGDVDAAKTISTLHQAWSTNAFEPVYWLDYLTKLSEIGHCTHQRANRLIQQDDLASSLIAFCVNLSN